MARNIEIKARVPDRQAIEQRIRAVADAAPSTMGQEDIFFCVSRGRLKLRRLSNGTAELIQYQRSDVSEPAASEYLKLPCREPELLQELLTRALGVRGVVRKERTLYRVGRTRIHLDHIENLGEFVELEVVLAANEDVATGEWVARDLMRTLGVRSEDLVSRAYIDLLED